MISGNVSFKKFVLVISALAGLCVFMTVDSHQKMHSFSSREVFNSIAFSLLLNMVPDELSAIM